MIVVAIIAILASLGVPAYQTYTQKAALTDLIKAMIPYKAAVEICALETATISDGKLYGKCQQGENGIPNAYNAGDSTVGYTKAVTVATGGVISITGQGTLSGLTVIMTPKVSSDGTVLWSRKCLCHNASLVTDGSVCI